MRPTLRSSSGGARYPYPKEVWTPSGGWWTRPANWKSNTALVGASMVFICYGIWQYSAAAEVGALLLQGWPVAWQADTDMTGQAQSANAVDPIDAMGKAVHFGQDGHQGRGEYGQWAALIARAALMIAYSRKDALYTAARMKRGRPLVPACLYDATGHSRKVDVDLQLYRQSSTVRAVAEATCLASACHTLSEATGAPSLSSPTLQIWTYPPHQSLNARNTAAGCTRQQSKMPSSSSDERPGMIITPELIRPRTNLQNLASTIQTWSSAVHSLPLRTSLRSSSGSGRQAGFSASLPPLDPPEHSDQLDPFAELERQSQDEGDKPIVPELPPSARVRWAKWHPLKRRRLLLVMQTSGLLQAWETSDLRRIRLAFSLDLKDLKLNTDGSDAIVVPFYSVDDPDALRMAIANRGMPAQLILYDSATSAQVASTSLPGKIVDMQVNHRYIALACERPMPSIHVFALDTLESLPRFPIMDVPSKPIFCLGLKRQLAYATTIALPRTAGSGIIGRTASGPFEQQESGPNRSLTQTALGVTGAQATQTARRLSEGVFNNVRATLNKWNAPEPLAGIPPASSSYSRSAPTTGASPAELATYQEDAAYDFGFVKVIDIERSQPGPEDERDKAAAPAVLSHFRPTHSALALLSLSPSGNMLLTASVQGRSFTIFELRQPSFSSSSPGKVWHRYTLNRGMTVANVTAASWSADARHVTLATTRGTLHMYAIQMLGGAPTPFTHASTMLINSEDMAPLSIVSSTVARMQRTQAAVDPTSTPTPPVAQSLIFTGYNEALLQDTEFAAHFSAITQRNPSSACFFVAFDPIHSLLQLYGMHYASPVTVGISSEVVAGARSGLTQMMRTHLPEGALALTASITPCAAWSLAPALGETAQLVADQPSESDRLARKTNWTAEAELETYSSSPLVLPKSIYLSHQFDFAVLHGSLALAELSKGIFAFQSRSIEVRQDVKVDGKVLSDAVPSPYGAPIRSAMHTVLDQDPTVFGSLSPSSLTPTFPNGARGRHGSWRDSAPTFSHIQVGLGRVRRELERAATTSTRRLSREGRTTSEISVSFEDDDAILAEEARDLPECNSAANDHVSTPITSMSDGNDVADDWAKWESDSPGREEKKEVAAATAPMERLSLEGEEDYDDFAIGLFDEQRSSLARPDWQGDEAKQAPPTIATDFTDVQLASATSPGASVPAKIIPGTLKPHGLDSLSNSPSGASPSSTGSSGSSKSARRNAKRAGRNV
ncbi:uncharacterized protein L969DRAFT_93913 [Mixia osmundae IAM 14324]|uniref:BCAS3 WD40 domain-containing protein n=1 Tax=Mixia osmundae (strain CBS 9802 / IAM 14324 / JCM 22182 / KY 12970) TaxID=764103 RepID=G7E9Y4_MIXOS|nr:uncharacterized protein L969DRAFT_93913 [Mixia osmundae IAM 14324]KEI40087.1 hypothetical protein L969DRAFT_93913 [Mixia osmundae IAM 14324]GAA99453.1 hypothetical protein E5Q_06152 [Mixia osmundae IAM 14324]